ncbi:uncharacterized protein LOC113278752 [Papaver somniferum]|uniref:uncharacterized protein LOC113278752 n=1 Tax=Papaver somniferum TaxID=3469 RepID=UPI000E6FDEE8|nr:uncharacterized protein LOC113278752 [Papaver somniferum]
MIDELLMQNQSRVEEQQILSMKKSMDSTFVWKIRRFRPPSNFIQPQFKDFFDVKNGNPVEHSNSIKDFGMLSDSFFEQYKINLGSKNGSSHLFLLHREPGESLGDFNIRFCQEVSEVGKVDESFVIEAYKNAMEERKESKVVANSKKDNVEEPAKPKQQFEGNTKNNSHEGPSRKVRNDEDSRNPQEKQRVKFPKLNIGLGEHFKKIKDSLPIPEPLPAETRDKRDKNKYCAHHKDHGHNTDTCRALAAEVQKMIEEGKLQQYVKNSPAQVNTLDNTLDLREIRVSHARVNITSRKAQENATRLKLRHINDWRVSNKVDYASLIGTETLEEGKTEISFSNADLAEVYQPHNDAIMILALIQMYKVRRVRDTGSSISVICSGAYSSMNLRERVKLKQMITLSLDSVGKQ